ncbi:hypothetical protein [Hymenobacter radiodurans]|uniref:hypothetical protein n=1 Tax=Hymenobacter radiodurans TaxID=2496028 RepID=UPI0010590D38|nr:hypothetical protein [Hymenobacter radiodurans]
MKTALRSLLAAAVLLLASQCASTPEQEAPTKYKSTPSARRAIEREPAAPATWIPSARPRRIRPFKISSVISQGGHAERREASRPRH